MSSDSLGHTSQWERASGERYLSDYGTDEWRYQCPHCGAHTIVVRKMVGEELQHLEYRDAPAVERWMRSKEIKRFRCDACSETFDDPYDKKLGERHELTLE